MNKSEFLKTLKNALGGIPAKDLNDILYDYEEHFSIGTEKGKSEAEIGISLGDPKAIAKQFRAEYLVKQAEANKSTGNIFRAIFATLSLGFFNLVFMLGPFIAAVAILFAFWATSGAVTFAGLVVTAATFFPSTLFLNVSFPIYPVPGFFIGIGTIALGLLMGIGTFYATKGFYNLIIAYIKLNLKIITKQEVKQDV